jgi:hypothetical protein
MPLWPVQLQPWTGNNLKRIVPVEVLVELDEPLTFTFRDTSHVLLLAHLCSQDEQALRYVVAPTTQQIVDQLKSGARTIIGALDQPIVWLMDLGSGATVTNAWVGTLADLPSHVLPASEVMLLSSLTPMIRLRATGPLISPGSLPARVVKTLVGGAENSVRSLTNYVTGRDQAGRPPAAYRTLYQLQAQQFAFRSFEVAFRPVDPTSGQLVEDPRANQVVGEVERLLSIGLQWVLTGEMATRNVDERQAILEAVKELSPPQGSPIERMEVSGRVVSSVFARDFPKLTKNTRQLAGSAIGDMRRGKALPDYVVRAGRVGAVDRDNRRVTVRNATENDITFDFEIDFLDDILDALNTQTNVSTVAARFVGTLWLVAIERLDDARPPRGDQHSVE